METEPLKAFGDYAASKGYEANFAENSLTLNNVVNPDNNFKIQKSDSYYSVNTVKVSRADYEYTAKCAVYLLLAEFNKDNSKATHLHLDYKVDL
jgi:hypothetical protein